MKLVKYQGSTLGELHLETMLAAAKNTPGWGKLIVTQGGNSHYSKSAGTHAKSDVADIDVAGKTKAHVWELCSNLFECGNLPFPRGFVNDSFQKRKHIHNLWWPCTNGSKALKDQYLEFLNGGDGLIGSGKYVGPTQHKLTTWANSMYNPANRVEFDKPKRMQVVNISTNLLGLNRYRTQAFAAPNGYQFDAIATIKRWNRINYLTRDGIFYASEYVKEIES